MAFLRRLSSALRAWVAGAPGWLGGVLAGLQAALFSLALVVIPTWTIVAAALPMGGALTPDWGASTSVAARLWLLGFGVPWVVDGVDITLIPLGLPLVTALILMALARRFADKTWTSWLCAVATFSAVIACVVMLVGNDAEGGRPRLIQAVMVAVMISAPMVALGIWRAHGATLAWVRRIPESVRAGLNLGIAFVGSQVVVAALAGAMWTAVGRHDIAEIATGLGPDTAGGLAFAVMETLWVPTLVVWYMSWLTGVGFEVGLTHFAPGGIVDGMLPQIPLVGALPHAYGGILAWAPVALVAIAAVLRWVMRARIPAGRERLAVMAVALAVVFAVAALLGWAASGGIGPGVLAYTGVQPWAFAGVSAALAGLGCILGELAVWGIAWLRQTAQPLHTVPGQSHHSSPQRPAPTQPPRPARPHPVNKDHPERPAPLAARATEPTTPPEGGSSSDPEGQR